MSPWLWIFFPDAPHHLFKWLANLTCRSSPLEYNLNLLSCNVKSLSLHTPTGRGEQAGLCLQLPFTFQKTVAISSSLQVKSLRSLSTALFPDNASLPRPFAGLTLVGPRLSGYGGAHGWTRRSLWGEQEGDVACLAGYTPAYRASSNVCLFHDSMVLLTHIQFMIDD